MMCIESVAAYHQSNYAGFSYLLRTSFDQALNSFEDQTISLLHIDGLHTYEAVSHDFYSWYPKVRPGGVILLHDIATRHNDFGVWRLWDDLQRDFPTFAFHHGYGLGVLQKPGGPIGDDLVSELIRMDAERQNTVRRYYALCGTHLSGAAQSQASHMAVRLYCPDLSGYSEDRSVFAHVRLNAWQQVHLRVRSAVSPGRLRLDPGDSPGMFEISELAIISAGQTEPLWSLDPAAADDLDSGGTAVRIRNDQFLTIVSDGDDPQILLPETPAAPDGICVRVLMRAKTGLAVVSAHFRSFAEEQRERLTDVDNRLQQVKAQATHYENLLKEERERAKDLDNWLIEEKSQAKHLEGMLEEV